MARFRKRLINRKEAERLLGEAWGITKVDGRLVAKFKLIEGTFKSMLQNANYIIRNADGVAIQNKLEWANRILLSVCLNDFYVNSEGEFQHPLSGFKIKKLVETTGYPFHNPDKVVVILASFIRDPHGYNCLLNCNCPNAAIFIERWSRNESASLKSARDTLSLTKGLGELVAFQLENQKTRLGKNVVILPYGYCDEYRATFGEMEDEEKKEIFIGDRWGEIRSQCIQRWDRIINSFLSDDGISEDENKIDISTTDEAVAEALADFDDVGDSDGADSSEDGADYANDYMGGKADTEEETSGRLADDDADLTKDPVFAQ